jgi:hypothetical protein
MSATVAAVTAGLLGTLAFLSIRRFTGARYPGMQSLCRWISLATLLAGLLLGGSSVLLGACGAQEIGKAAMLGCGTVIFTQLAGWLLFAYWLPNRRVDRAYDERALLQSLAVLADLAAAVAQ